jgi:hypothetical protein
LRKELKATTVRVKRITRSQLQRMYELFSEYYTNHTFESFTHDLMEKNHVILLHDKKNKNIEGFSTLLRVPMKKGNKQILGVYSGDTVVNKEYWGSPALGVEFLIYLWKLKMKRPGIPVYWFLISKGYKTYLIMARNFATHYPRYEEPTPPIYEELMDNFYSMKFKHHYSSETGLITYEDDSCALKDSVAEITSEHLKDPRIAFFVEKNPKWSHGHELTCIAKMTVFMPLKYMLKKTFKVRTR